MFWELRPRKKNKFLFFPGLEWIKSRYFASFAPEEINFFFAWTGVIEMYALRASAPEEKNFFSPGWSESIRDFCELRPGRNKFFFLPGLEWSKCMLWELRPRKKKISFLRAGVNQFVIFASFAPEEINFFPWTGVIEIYVSRASAPEEE
jgi:hypothetical protein